MNTGRIPINLAPLRFETGRFTIRFTDINEPKKNLLAKRIKETASIYTIRRASGPSLLKIYNTLTEINPIIFSENICRDYIPRESTRNFNIYEVMSIQGYYFRKLCAAIYHIDCLKRPLRRKEIEDIAYLTCGDWHQSQSFVQNNFVPTVIEISPIRQTVTIPEIGLEEMERVRLRAISNGADQVPNSMFSRETEEENQENQNQFITNRSLCNEATLEYENGLSTMQRRERATDAISPTRSHPISFLGNNIRNNTPRINDIRTEQAPIDPAFLAALGTMEINNAIEDLLEDDATL